MSFEGAKPEGARVAGAGGSKEAVKSKRSTCWAFFKRFWWAFLILGLVAILLIIIIIIYAIIPKVAQSKLNDAVLTIEGLRVTQTQTNSVYTEINSTISSNSGISANFDGFNASLYLEDKQPQTPFAYLQMPATTAGSAVAVNVSQLLNIYDAQAYADYNTWYLLNETFRMTITGTTKVHIGSLPAYNVNFAKTVNVTGLNAFKGLNITSSSVSGTPDAQGDNFHGFVTIPNPSVLTVDIGNTTFAQVFNGTNVGFSYIDNLFLYPGMNNFSIRANISQVPILEAVLSEPYCANGGILPMEFIGTSVVNNGQHLPYFEAGFKQNVQQLQLDVGADLKAGLGITVSCPKRK